MLVYSAGEQLFVTFCKDKIVEQCQVYCSIYIDECKVLGASYLRKTSSVR